MKHFYSDAQKAATSILYNSYADDATIQSVDVLGSVYMPLMVFIRVRRIEIDDTGGGGLVTDYISVDFEGYVTREANKNLPFDSDKARLTVFSELTPINKP
jgi:hypothetical protein